MSFNTFGSRKRSLGSSFPVWLSVDAVKHGGGTLYVPDGKTFEETYGWGKVIPAGTPIELPESGGVIKILETYALAVAVAAADTKLQFRAAGNVPQVDSNTVIMVAPKTYDGTGTAISTGTVVKNETTGFLEVTITAGALGALPAGTIFVKSSGTAGTNRTMEAIYPNALLFNDIYTEEGTEMASGAAAYHGKLMIDRVAPIPASVRANLPMISFEGGI